MAYTARELLTRLQAEYGIDPTVYPTRHAPDRVDDVRAVHAPRLCLALGYAPGWCVNPRQPRRLTAIQVFGQARPVGLDIFNPETSPIAAIRP